MAIIKCPECGKEISDKSIYCINCGFPINNAAVDRKVFRDEASPFENEDDNYKTIQDTYSNTASANKREENQSAFLIISIISAIIAAFSPFVPTFTYYYLGNNDFSILQIITQQIDVNIMSAFNSENGTGFLIVFVFICYLAGLLLIIASPLSKLFDKTRPTSMLYNTLFFSMLFFFFANLSMLIALKMMSDSFNPTVFFYIFEVVSVVGMVVSRIRENEKK